MKWGGGPPESLIHATMFELVAAALRTGDLEEAAKVLDKAAAALRGMKQ